MDKYSEHILDTIQSATEQWVKENPESRITEEVHRTLEEGKSETIRILLGFKQDYPGGPLVINTNAYLDDKNPVLKFIKNTAEQEIRNWFNSIYIADVLQDWELKQKFEEAYKIEYEEQFNLQLKERINIDVKNDVANFMVELREGPLKLLDKRKTVEKLLKRNNDDC